VDFHHETNEFDWQRGMRIDLRFARDESRIPCGKISEILTRTTNAPTPRIIRIGMGTHVRRRSPFRNSSKEFTPIHLDHPTLRSPALIKAIREITCIKFKVFVRHIKRFKRNL